MVLPSLGAAGGHSTPHLMAEKSLKSAETQTTAALNSPGTKLGGWGGEGCSVWGEAYPSCSGWSGFPMQLPLGGEQTESRLKAD